MDNLDLWRGEMQSDMKSLLADSKQMVQAINQIDVTLARQATSLEVHIKRTDALEKRVEQVHELSLKAKGIWWFVGWMIGGIAIATEVGFHIKELFFP